MEWIQYGLPALTAIIVAVIEAKSVHDRKIYERDKAERDERSKNREEQLLLSMHMMSAVCDSVRVITKAVTGQHINGDVEASMKGVDEAQTEYRDFIDRVAVAHTVAK